MHKLFHLDARAMNTPWLESPFTAHLLRAAHHLDPAMLAMAQAYARDGYVIMDSEADPALFDTLVTGLDDYYRDGPRSNQARIQDAWLIPDAPIAGAVRQLATLPKVHAVLRELYLREPIPFQTLNFPRGTQQQTHSDTIHFNSVPERFMCGVWLALEDIHAESGPLQYYPGSHKLPIYNLHDIGIMGSGRTLPNGQLEIYGEAYSRYERFIASLVEAHGLQRHELVIKKGQALIWSANLLHGGSIIADPALSRHSQVTHYYFSDCLYYTPLGSDPFIGAVQTRTIRDLRTGRLVQSSYNGRQVTVTEPGAPARLLPEPGPMTLATQAPHRVLAWPRYDSDAQLQGLAACARPLAQRADVCLCLRHDPSCDPPLDRVKETLMRILGEALGDNPALEVLIVDNPLTPKQWPQLGHQATCMVQFGDESPTQKAFLRAAGLPAMLPHHVSDHLPAPA